MKMRIIAAASMSLIMGTAIAATNLSSKEDKLSYSIGADFGANFKNQGIQINSDAFSQGLKDAMSGAKLQMTQEQMKDTIQKFQQELMAKKIKAIKEQADANKKKGEAFLKANAKKPGVVSLPSGLQYQVITKGKGAKPTKEDTVTVEYTGTLIDGKVFDSSEKTGKPATFKLSQVIPGWTEALQLMQEGATWKIFVPSKLAYGQRGVGGPIGPNETLIFKIHLISIKKA